MYYHLLTKKLMSQNLANAAFLLLFPGFFFYHFAIARDYIPPVLGGYFGVVASFFLPFLAFVDLKYKYYYFGSKVFLFFIAIVIYTLVVTVCNYYVNEPYGYSYDMAVWSLSGVIFNVVGFLIGANINFQKIMKINFVVLILMLLVVVFNVGEHGIFYVKQEAIDGSDVATYQGFARSIVFVSLILTGFFIKKSKMLILIFMISVATLLLNGARTEFVAYVVTSLFVFFLYSFRSLKGVVILISALTVLFFVTSYLVDMYPDSRMLQLFALQESSSFDARYDLNSYGLSLIADSPLIGAYGMYVYLDGIGSYPHNLLSAWVNLGVFGFTFYLVLFFILIRAAFLGFKKNSNNLTYRIFLIFLLFTLLVIVTSKDYSYMMIGFLVGIFINWRNLNNFERK